jgi:hypothetical protein
MEIPPVNSVSESASLPLEFFIKGMPEHYPDLHGSEIYMKVKIVHEDGTHIGKDEKVGPVNLFAHSMFSQIDLYINDELVTKNQSLYPYRAYLETLLNYGDDAKNSWLESCIYHPDTEGEAFDQTDPAGIPINSGYIARSNYAAESKTFDMVWRPHLDMFMQPRPLLNNVNVRLKLTRSKPEFCLMSGAGDKRYIIMITHAAFFARMVKVNAPLATEHRHILEHNGKMYYPVKRVDMNSFTIPSGVLSHTRTNLVNGQLPKRLLLGLTSNISYNGSYRNSPFKFSHWGINKICLIVNGRSVPTRPFTPNFIDGGSGVQYTRCFHALSSVCSGTSYGNFGNGITRKAYANGYTLFAFSICEDGGVETFGLIRDGNVQLEMSFASPTANVLNAVIYLEYENTLSIDKHGAVSLDYYA